LGSGGVLVVGLSSSSTVGALNGSGSAVAKETGAVLAGESEELVALGALGNLDTVLVGPLLDLAVGPRVEKSVAEALLSSRGGGRDLGVGTLEVEASDARLTADVGNEAVTGGGLGNGVAALIEPGLQVRVGPGFVEPVTGVVDSLGDLVGSGLVVLADRLEEGVALAGLGNGNAMLVGKGLQLRVGPTRCC
jgi:hypothetical protein